VLFGLAMTAALAGCPAPDTPVATAGFDPDTGPVGTGLTVHILPDVVVLYAVPPGTDATVVDYVIIAQKTKEIVYHVESAANMSHFRLEVERQKLPKGIYHLKVFVDKSKTPLDERDITTP
jgi:hypothetical protein